MDINNMNVAHLACIGDAIYELKIRQYLIFNKKLKINDINNEKIKYVSAKNQAMILDNIMLNNKLTDEEEKLILRSRNYKPASKPKNVSIVTYKKATALESLFGKLYLDRNEEKIDKLIRYIMGDEDVSTR